MARIKIGNVFPSLAWLMERCAPAGFGLGGSARHFDINDIDNIKQSGWYYSNNPNGYDVAGFPVYFVQMKVDSWWEVEGVNMVVQTLYYDVCQIRRICDANGWRPWEWVNPPMKVGQEYRTTERWLSKPVFTKLIDCEELPTSGRKAVYIGEIGNIIRYAGCCNYRSLPYRDPNANGTIDVGVESSYVVFNVNVDEGMQSMLGTAYMQIWYTKD